MTTEQHPPPEDDLVTRIPPASQYRLGRCAPCKGRHTVVAPALYYLNAAGALVSMPACERHHEAFVAHVHRMAMQAVLPVRTPDWS
ncbi:hypothetical protein ACWGB8_35495 [Kitasatospora sp. NPDC054939]